MLTQTLPKAEMTNQTKETNKYMELEMKTKMPSQRKETHKYMETEMQTTIFMRNIVNLQRISFPFGHLIFCNAAVYDILCKFIWALPIIN